MPRALIFGIILAGVGLQPADAQEAGASLATTSQYLRRAAGWSVKIISMVARPLGMGAGSMLRRMSHINRLASRLPSDASALIQRCPQTPIASTTGCRSRPALVSRYSNMPGSPRTGERDTIPAASRSFKRFDSSAGDMRGTPRRSSLKRVEPTMSSRKTTSVQRAHRISDAMATGQN